MGAMFDIRLLLIDPQNDFCRRGGSLFIPGADLDSIRLAGVIDRFSKILTDIHVTQDTHHHVSIFHPVFWVDSQGKHPVPFTLIFEDDVLNGKYRATNPGMQKWAEYYVKTLKTNGRHVLCIWPYHCEIGTEGHNTVQVIAKALSRWEDQFANVDYVPKGTNFKTEHYSAVKADVEDPSDLTTQMNTGLIETLEMSDLILLSGQAHNFCLNFTTTDIVNEFGKENIKKIVLLEDTTSSVVDPPGQTDFAEMTVDFMSRMKSVGMQSVRSADIDGIGDINTLINYAQAA